MSSTEFGIKEFINVQLKLTAHCKTFASYENNFSFLTILSSNYCFSFLRDDKGSELSVAEFELMVENPSQNFPLSNLVSSPCQLGHYGRWKSENNFEGNNEEVDFKFEEFGCSGPLTPFSEFATKMNSKNIFEISFVGDEHLRNSFFHLQFLLSGRVYSRIHKWKEKTKKVFIFFFLSYQ